MSVLGSRDGKIGSKNEQKWVNSYGMELSRVGAFTDFGGLRYRNPVQILRENSKNRPKLEF